MTETKMMQTGGFSNTNVPEYGLPIQGMVNPLDLEQKITVKA